MEERKRPKYGLGQSVRFMLGMAWKYRRSTIWVCLLYAAIQLGLNLCQLFIAPVVLSKVEQAAPLPELLGSIGVFSCLLISLNALLAYVNEGTLFDRVEVRTAIINDLNEKACTTSFPNTRDPEVLKLQEKAMNACSGNQQPTEHFWDTMTALLLNFSAIVLYLGILSSLHWVLIGVVAGTSVLGFVLTRRINEWGYRHREEEAGYAKQLSYITKQSRSITLAKDIRLFGLGPWLDDILDGVLRAYDAFIRRRERVYFWSCVTDVVLGVARNAIAYGYLIALTVREGLPASQFLLYFSAFTGFTALITAFLSECSTLHKECLELSVVQEYLHYPEPFRFEGGKPIPKADGYELRLENVSFTYPGTRKPILQHLNLTIHPGEKLAVVGLNGAGKTTLVSLLCGFYDPDEGRVLLNGTDIREFNRREYYGLFSAVFQNCSDLDITVAQWVAQAVDGIDMDKVKDCIQKAGLTQQIEAFPSGYDTHLGKKVYKDGVQLSGGQLQRLMLARALYKDGPILTLDEPTAALDPIAEHDIYQKYSEMTAGKTSVFISHRLASTRFCDRILFLQDGAIAEEGTHQQLLELGGEYAKLFQVQARYYQEGGAQDET